jgi:hypothetical protein
VIKYARSVNGFGRLITVHPTGLDPLSGRLLFKDQSLLDFDMLQTGHGMREVLAPTIRALRASHAARPVMPVVNGEVCYEALMGKIPAEIPRLMFWTSMLSGAAGHTYGANGLWQLNRRGQPYGKSPHGGTYGPIPWDDAMNLPGSGQLGEAKRFLEHFPWHQLEPHPEWAAWGETEKGKSAASDEFQVPYTAGIPRRLRITYVPLARAVTVKNFEADVRYVASCFDPISGEQSQIGAVHAGSDGSWTTSPPPGIKGDWVVALKAVGSKKP